MARRPITDTTIGERIAARRQLLRMSVRFAADRAGLSPSTWSRIERGLVGADNRFTLAKIAEALRCPVSDLTGQPSVPTDATGAEVSGAVYDTITAVIESDLRFKPAIKAPAMGHLRREVELISELRMKCDYMGAAKRLPDLIRSLHAAAFGKQRAEALRALVMSTEDAAFVVRYAGEPPAAYLVAERSQQAAEELGDPVMLGLAAWSRSHAASGCGLYKISLTIADQGATALRPHIDKPDAAEMYGALLLQTAFASYAQGMAEEAEVRLTEAAEIAERTGDSAALRLMFGPNNVRFWRVAMETDAGDPGRAVAVARETKPQAVPRVSRQTWFYLDTGRALARIGKDQDAVRMLLTAERLGPQLVRNSPLAAETARTLLERAQRNSAGAELRGFCERLGVLV